VGSKYPNGRAAKGTAGFAVIEIKFSAFCFVARFSYIAGVGTSCQAVVFSTCWILKTSPVRVFMST
jgi:hypothetical protein